MKYSTGRAAGQQTDLVSPEAKRDRRRSKSFCHEPVPEAAAACTDGFRPVVFKIETLPIEAKGAS